MSIQGVTPTQLSEWRKQKTVDGGGNPPHDESMEARVQALETDMRDVREGVAVIKSNYATKEDLHREINAQTWKFVTWVSTIATALVAATYFIAKHV